MLRSNAPRRGIALLAAIIALAIVAALLTAAFFSALEADRSVLLVERQAGLRAIAGRALEIALSQWNTAARVAQAVGSTATVPSPPAVGNARTRVWVTRISPHAFWLYARVADDRDTTANAGAGMVVTLVAPRLPRLGALVSRGGVRFDGVAGISGDPATAGLPCDSLTSAVNDLVVAPGASAPSFAVRLSAAAAESTYSRFGAVDLASLAASLGATVQPGTTILTPSAPITLALGDVSLQPGSGSGIVLVQGRLHLFGPLHFTGALIATGGLEVAAGDVTITGLVLGGADNDSSVVVNAGGRLDLRYSECVLQGVELAVSVARPARVRARVQMP